MEAELVELKTTPRMGRDDDLVDVEAGQSSTGDDAEDRRQSGGSGEEGTEGEGGEEVVKKETVVLRLGEGKIEGPMRFITCYASVFTFTVMIGIIMWLLIISPPFTVKPEILPGRSNSSSSSSSTVTRTTVLPLNTETPEFSSDFNQA
ncbi:hypothetical protein Hamer_G010139 [Homarus americanus]|uniref:Uncharacterized protein n=1 Tax=Homarus americanus TaxID=6706 RepID=A0A8J5MY55_HOMAM|nr:hypothetical protein Hamer_G010139 [Homarus americanus]